jgi:hypothetical protein
MEGNYNEHENFTINVAIADAYEKLDSIVIDWVFRSDSLNLLNYVDSGRYGEEYRDLKSLVGYPTCRFEFGPWHSIYLILSIDSMDRRISFEFCALADIKY